MDDGFNTPFKEMHIAVREKHDTVQDVPPLEEQAFVDDPRPQNPAEERCVARVGDKFPDPAFNLRLAGKNGPDEDENALFLRACAALAHPPSTVPWGRELRTFFPADQSRDVLQTASPMPYGENRPAEETCEAAACLQAFSEDEEEDRTLFLKAFNDLQKPQKTEEETAFGSLRTVFRNRPFARKQKNTAKEDRSRDSTLFLRAVEKLSAAPKQQTGFLSLAEQCSALQKFSEKKRETGQKAKERDSARLQKPLQISAHMRPHAKSSVAYQKQDVLQPSEEESDRAAFLRAVSGTTPLENKYITPEKPAVKPLVPRQESLAELLEGRYTFEFFCRDEYFEGYISGLDQMTVDKLRTGRLSPEAHLDLHGFVVDEAYEALRSFIRSCWFKGLRTVLVVPGRGHNSIQGIGVLRGRLQVWLTQEPLKRVVLAFCTAQPSDGGPGSVYVLLRKYKKKGRVNWERFSDDLWT